MSKTYKKHDFHQLLQMKISTRLHGDSWCDHENVNGGSFNHSCGLYIHEDLHFIVRADIQCPYSKQNFCSRDDDLH